MNEPPSSDNEAHRDAEAIRRVLELMDQSDTPGGESSTDVDLAALAAVLADLWTLVDHSQAGDGVPTIAPQVELPQRIGRFEIRRLLGCGGFGMVLLAYDPALAREVALKVPRPEIFFSSRLRQRFLREAQAVAELDHPHIVPVFEAAEQGTVWCLTHAYIAGPNLAVWLQQQGAPLPPRLAVDLILQLTQAVEHAHAHGVLHRDLKPSNVLLEPRAEEPSGWYVRLVDFGLAKRLDDDEHLSRAGELVGTPQYMAPEQAAGQTVDISVQSDVYSIGAILFEMLTGRPPYVGSTRQQTLQLIQAGQAPTAPLVAARVPKDLQAICTKCLASCPADRYRSAGDLSTDLGRFLRGEPVAARTVGTLVRAWMWCRRRPATSAFSAAASLVLLGSLTFAVWQGRAAVIYNRLVERSLVEAEQGMVNLAWAQDEALRTPQSNDPIRIDLRRRLRQHYETMLDTHSIRRASRPFQATIESLRGRVAELSDHYSQADVNYRRSIALWRSLLAEDPDNSQYMRALAENLYSWKRLQQALNANSPPLPRKANNEALFTELLREDGGRGTLCVVYVQMLMDRGEALAQLGADHDAREVFSVACDLCIALAVTDRENRDYIRGSCRAILLWGTALERTGGNPAAEDAVTVSEQQMRGLTELEPLNENDRLLQAQLGRLIAHACRKHGDAEKALAYYQGVHQVLHGLPEDHWQQHCIENLLADTTREIAQLHAKARQPHEQLAMLDESVEMAERARRGGYISRENLGDLPYTYADLGDCARQLLQLDRATEAYHHACDVFRLTVGRSVKVREGYLAWADCHAKLGELARQQQDLQTASAQYRAAISVVERLRDEHSDELRAQARIDTYRECLSQLSASTLGHN